MHERYPTYALADLTVNSRDERKEVIVKEVLEALAAHLAEPPTGKEEGAAE